MWRICPIFALFVKIRQICTSPSGHQRPLNRGCFYPKLYPIRTSETLPEHQYEGRFFERRLKKVKNTNPAILFPNHSYNSILDSVPLSGNRTGRAEAGFFGERAGNFANRTKYCFPISLCAIIVGRAFPAGAHHLILRQQVISLHQYRSRSYRSRYTPRDRTSCGKRSV